jgi:hypothetical protein
MGGGQVKGGRGRNEVGLAIAIDLRSEIAFVAEPGKMKNEK